MFLFGGWLPLLLALYPVSGPAAANPSPHSVLQREKWLWHSGFDDFIPPFFESKSLHAPAPSFGSCWRGGLFTDEAWPSSWNHPSLQHELALERVSCYRVLGMEEAALGACRQMLLLDPFGDAVGPCIHTIIEILFYGGNTESALAFYDLLDPGQQALVSPESLYLLGQSGFLLERDEQASALLEQVPPESDAYPLAVYSRVQVAFRSGDWERALTWVRLLTQGDATPPIPDLLEEQARLTMAHILFQQQRYEEAARVFRQLNRSRYFLPEALMGMGWVYEAMGSPASAIPYFDAAQEAAPLDILTQSQAELERARLHAENGLHEDADRIFRQAQDRMEAYILFLERAPHDPAWVAGQVETLLPPSGDRPEEAARARDMDPAPGAWVPGDPQQDLLLPHDPPVFQREMAAVLQKESFLSARMQELLAIRDALLQVRRLVDHPPEPEQRFPVMRGIPTRPTPPLDTRDMLLPPETIRLLDAAFALLDTEYRLSEAVESLGLGSSGDRNLFLRDALDFYGKALPALILDPPQTSRDRDRALAGIMVLVRHLPYPAQERERIMKKLVHTQEVLQYGEETLLRWSQSMEEVGTGVAPPSRRLLLRLWMRYAKSLVYLRSWQERSPAVFLFPSITTGPESEPEHLLRSYGREEVLSDRIAQVWQRLGTYLQEEILRFCGDRLAAFEALRTDSDLYYAEALLKYQESLLQELQQLPPDAESKDTREVPPTDRLPPTPSTDET